MSQGTITIITVENYLNQWNRHILNLWGVMNYYHHSNIITKGHAFGIITSHTVPHNMYLSCNMKSRSCSKPLVNRSSRARDSNMHTLQRTTLQRRYKVVEYRDSALATLRTLSRSFGTLALLGPLGGY